MTLTRARALDRARAVLVICALVGVGALSTSASWSGAQFAAAEMGAGTFALVSRTEPGEFAAHGADAPASLGWTQQAMYPGESRAAWMQVQASGSVGGTVQLTGIDFDEPIEPGSSDAALRDAVRVRIGASSDDAAGEPVCDASTEGVEVSGLDALPQLAPVALEARHGSTATYCIVVSLPLDAADDAQNGAVSPVWTFTGTSG